MSVRTLSQQKLSSYRYNTAVTSNVGYGSVQFNGTDQYLEIANNTGFNFPAGTDFTVEFWMRPLAVSACSPVGKNYAGNSWEFYYNWYSDRSMTFGYGDATFTSAVAAVPAGAWTHVAGTRSGSTSRLFINGSLAGSQTASYNADGTNTVHIGGGDGLGGYLNGYVSNVRIVKGTAVYTSNFTVPTTPLTAISGTTLLACQGVSATADNSPYALTISTRGATPPTVSTLNPFRT